MKKNSELGNSLTALAVIATVTAPIFWFAETVFDYRISYEAKQWVDIVCVMFPLTLWAIAFHFNRDKLSKGEWKTGWEQPTKNKRRK